MFVSNMKLYFINWQFCELLQHFAVLKRINLVHCEKKPIFKWLKQFSEELQNVTKSSSENYFQDLRIFLKKLYLLSEYLWTLNENSCRLFSKIHCFGDMQIFQDRMSYCYLFKWVPEETHFL